MPPKARPIHGKQTGIILRWKDEALQDAIALTGNLFYALVLVRILVDRVWIWSGKFSAGLAAIYLVHAVGKRLGNDLDLHAMRGSVLLVLIASYYKDIAFTVFMTGAMMLALAGRRKLSGASTSGLAWGVCAGIAMGFLASLIG